MFVGLAVFGTVGAAGASGPPQGDGPITQLAKFYPYDAYGGHDSALGACLDDRAAMKRATGADYVYCSDGEYLNCQVGVAMFAQWSTLAPAVPPARPACSGGTAATASVPVIASCDLHVGTTYRSGNQIRGDGWRSGNCGVGTSYVEVQRSRWYGWETMQTANVNANDVDYGVGYDCGGTGQYEYRVIHEGYTAGGDYLFAESNHITAGC
jgi:hypothetical protein